VIDRQYRQQLGLLIQRKQYRNERNIDIKSQEIYSPMQLNNYYKYVHSVDLHLNKAISNRKYAVTWLYVLMHLIDAWRHSDIIKLPPIPIEVTGIATFEQLLTTKLSAEKALLLVDQVASRIERMYVSKTGAMSHFLVNKDMQIPAATVLIIAELHRRKTNDEYLIRFSKSNRGAFNQSSSLFFKERPDLETFKSLKMNRTLLTYFFHSVAEIEGNADIAYELAQRLRAHKELDTTATYIQATNSDGSLDKVSINLFNRGHFGWLYHFMIHALFQIEINKLTMEQQTILIQEFRSKYTPGNLEGMAYFLKSQHDEKVSLALKIANMPKSEIQTTLNKVFRGEMPAKIQHAQCLVYPNCSSPTASTCLTCSNIIPKTFLMISIIEEINKRVDSINNLTQFGSLLRDTSILWRLLDILTQAKIEFGLEYINQYLDLKTLEKKLVEIEHKMLFTSEDTHDKK
ncbi:MAG: hypothetical protein WD469_12785, partial [Paenibacillaceae bacterium]